MAMYQKGNQPFLYDEDTGDIVALRDPDGSYTPILTPAEVLAARNTSRTTKRLAIIGDSFSAPESSSSYTGNCWWIYTLAELGWPYDVVAVSAVSGRTTSAALAAFDTEISPYTPDEIWILLGQNDRGSVSAAQAALICLQSIVTKAKALGVSRIICGTPCDNTSATSATYNALLTYQQGLLSMQQAGLIHVADSHMAYADITNAYAAASSSLVRSDNFHPSAKGARRIGYAFKQVVSALPVTSRSNVCVAGSGDYVGTNSASSKICLNPLFVGTGGTAAGAGTVSGSVPADWTLNVPTGFTVTVTTVQETLPRARNWVRLTITGTSATADTEVTLMQYVSASTVGFINGKKARPRVTFRVSGTSDNFFGVGTAINLFTSGYVQRASGGVGGGAVAYSPGEFPTTELVFEGGWAINSFTDVGLVQNNIKIRFGAAGTVTAVVDITEVTNILTSA